MAEFLYTQCLWLIREGLLHFAEDAVANLCALYMRICDVCETERDLLQNFFPQLLANPLVEKLMQKAQAAYEKMQPVDAALGKRTFFMQVQQAPTFGSVLFAAVYEGTSVYVGLSRACVRVVDAVDMRRVLHQWSYSDIGEVIDLPSCVKISHGNLMSYGASDNEAVFMTTHSASIKAVHLHFASMHDTRF